MSVDLYDYQLKAIDQMHNGCILVGKVGTGKSRTALAYYILKECKGKLVINGKGSLGELENPRDLYIITTAKKRDTEEWYLESGPFQLSDDPRYSVSNVSMIVDSWNNIGKYKNVKNAFFIFDEQRVVGRGAWSKSFIKIAKQNHWILLSATPGDTWSDYIPVFIANGFYLNRSDFVRQHVVYDPYVKKYPKVKKYLNTGKLIKERASVLVNMDAQNVAKQNHISIKAGYDRAKYSFVEKKRWNIYKNEPIQDGSTLCYLLRRIVNSDPDRVEQFRTIIFTVPRSIVFYNFNYELELLRQTCEELMVPYSEWNGQKHQNIPSGDRWCYLVQYEAGAEGWNCITTDTIIFYSQNYSYKRMVQAAGRIDRANTPYDDLYYYHIKSSSKIDTGIANALNQKKSFNEKAFLEKI